MGASCIGHPINRTQKDVGGSGSVMPRGRSPVDAVERAVSETWILEGP